MSAKKKLASVPDKHASGFMVRLPEEIRDALATLKDKTGQSYTWAVRKAVEAYLKENGVELPRK